MSRRSRKSMSRRSPGGMSRRSPRGIDVSVKSMSRRSPRGDLRLNHDVLKVFDRNAFHRGGAG